MSLKITPSDLFDEPQFDIILEQTQPTIPYPAGMLNLKQAYP